MIKRLLSVIVVLLIVIAITLLVTDEDKPSDETEQEINGETFEKEEFDPLMEEVRTVIQKSNNILLTSSREELIEIIEDTWDDPEFALEMNGKLIDWILSQETKYKDIKTIFSNEAITSTEHGDFITYTATVEIFLYDEDDKETHKKVTGIFNIVKREGNTYKIQNLQLLEPAKSQKVE